MRNEIVKIKMDTNDTNLDLNTELQRIQACTERLVYQGVFLCFRNYGIFLRKMLHYHLPERTRFVIPCFYDLG